MPSLSEKPTIGLYNQLDSIANYIRKSDLLFIKVAPYFESVKSIHSHWFTQYVRTEDLYIVDYLLFGLGAVVTLLERMCER